MRGIDTNVLARYLAQDDAAQAKAVDEVIHGDFADYVMGRRNRRAGCDRTVTFDRSLKGSGAFTVL